MFDFININDVLFVLVIGLLVVSAVTIARRLTVDSSLNFKFGVFLVVGIVLNILGITFFYLSLVNGGVS
jgi:hypothetical protein